MGLTANITRGNPLSVDLANHTALTATAAEHVFMTGGRLFTIIVSNSHSNRATLKLYNAKDVTVGTTAPHIVLALNGGSDNDGHTTAVIATGLKMSTSFSMAATKLEGFANTTDPDDTSLAVDVVFARTTDI